MFILLLISLLAPLHSAEVLTWDACVKEVMMNNLDLKTARENVDVYRYKRKALWSAFMPGVTAGIDSSYNSNNSGSSSSHSSLNATNPLYAASLTVNQNLFNGFQSVGQLRESEGYLESQEASYQSVRATVSYNLMNAYAQVLYAKNYVKLTQDIVKRQTDNYNLVKLNFEGGMENKGSLLLAQASLEEAVYDTGQAQRLLETYRQQLAAVLGRKAFAPDVDIDDTMPNVEPEKNIDLEQLALQTPQYKIAQAQVKVNQADLTIARSNFYPSLDFISAVTQQGNRWPFPNSGWSAMLGLTFPLFSGGKDLFTTYSSSSLLSASLFSQDSTDLQLLYNLRNAYNSLIDAIGMVKVYETYVIAANTRAIIARGKYNNGLMDFEDWVIIETDLIAKQKTAVQTVLNRHLAEATWLMAQGKGVIQ
jgi:outer membrane protein TolC